MKFKEELLKLSERVARQKEQIMTEEATKTAFVLPFIQTLGYDIFDPCEVEPEHTCDIGTKKGEKIDYAIKNEGEPILLVECKHWSENLALHCSQLFRYYVTSKARFAILTNGVQYRFFSDSEKANIMDSCPFFEIDITDINEYQIEQLRKFHKHHFNEHYIFATIPSIRYIHDIHTRSFDERTRLQEENVCVRKNYEDASAEIVRLQNQLERNRYEYEERLRCQSEIGSQKISELETALKNATEKPLLKNHVTGDEDELDLLIDYLNMPVPNNWYKNTTLSQRRHYWKGGRSSWSGKPRDTVCTSEVAREFYGFEAEDFNPMQGRRVGEAIHRTGLFIRDSEKKRFGEYGVAVAWIRKKSLIKSLKRKK